MTLNKFNLRIRDRLKLKDIRAHITERKASSNGKSGEITAGSFQII